MNKKVTVRTEHKKVVYCILDGSKDAEEQFNLWYFGAEHPSGGLCVCFDWENFEVKDYYHNEQVAAFDVLGVEDTDQPPILKWIDVQTNKQI